MLSIADEFVVVELAPGGAEEGVDCCGEGFLNGENDGRFRVAEGVKGNFPVGGGWRGGFEREGWDPLVRGLRMLVWSLDV